MNDITEYCAKKAGARLEFPFGLIPICFKVGSRLFIEINPKENDLSITVRCDPVLAEAYRQQYPGVVKVGYHCPARQKPFKNTVSLNKGLPDGFVYRMIDHSYDEAVKRLKKEERERLEGGTEP